jgi:hypothetical protein
MKNEHWFEAEENLRVCTFKGLAGGIVHLQNKVLDRGLAPNLEANPLRQLQLWRISCPCIYHLQQQMSSSWFKVYDHHCETL